MNNQVILTGTSEDLVVNVQVPPGQPLTTDLEVDGDPVTFANPLPVGVTNQVDVEVQNFPGNLATSDLQTTSNTTLAAISAKLPSVLASDRLKVDGSGVTQPISGSVTATISGTPTVDTELPAAIAASDAISNPTAPQVLAHSMIWDSTGSPGWRRMPGTINGIHVQGQSFQGAGIVGGAVTIGGGDESILQRRVRVFVTDPVAATDGLVVRNVPGRWVATKTAAGAPALSLVVRNGPCWLKGFTISNNTSSQTYFAAIYNLTAAPTGGNAATARVTVGQRVAPPGTDPGELVVDFGTDGLYLSTGCVIALESSADPTNTTYGSGAGASISAQYRAAT